MMDTSTYDERLVDVVRPVGRRLVIELVVIGVLAGVGATFPREVDAGTAWGFLIRHWTVLGHAVLGAVILVEAVALVMRTERSTSGMRGLAVIGLGCVALSLLSGIAYVSLHQPDTALVTKTVGWLGAVTAYSTSWVRSRHTRQRRN